MPKDKGFVGRVSPAVKYDSSPSLIFEMGYSSGKKYEGIHLQKVLGDFWTLLERILILSECGIVLTFIIISISLFNLLSLLHQENKIKIKLKIKVNFWRIFFASGPGSGVPRNRDLAGLPHGISQPFHSWWSMTIRSMGILIIFWPEKQKVRVHSVDGFLFCVWFLCIFFPVAESVFSIVCSWMLFITILISIPTFCVGRQAKSAARRGRRAIAYYLLSNPPGQLASPMFPK